MKFNCKALTLTLLVLFFQPMHAQEFKEPKISNKEWIKNYPPFRIAGNLYYVGSYDLSAFLVTTSSGHILINTGLGSSPGKIRARMKKLGFRYQDIKILLTTQAHFDHVGGTARVKEETGAKLFADEGDVSVFEDGGKSDYIFGSVGSTFKPVKVDRILHDGDTVSLGDAKLVHLHHPGHTKGSCSYLLNVRDEKNSYRILVANIPTILPQADLKGMQAYPDIGSDYASALAAMSSLKFDLWVASHASQFYLHEKHKPGAPYNPEVFRDQTGYEKALLEVQKEFNKRR